MAISNIQTIDLAHIRETFPSPTCDVKFTFVDQNTGVMSELLAHKLVLALGCDVFMAQFYGPHMELRDTIPVEDSSAGAFKILMELLYNKKVAFENLGIKLLAELFYLADKFILDDLKDAIVMEVSSRKMVVEKLLESAKVAEDQVHLERFSEALYKVCVKFVKDNIYSIFELFDSEAHGGDNSLALHRLMAKANRIQPAPSPSTSVCENCKQSPCLHGQVLTRDNFVINAQVLKEDVSEAWSRETIRFIDNADINRSDQVVYKCKDVGGNLVLDGRVDYIAKFKYKCK